MTKESQAFFEELLDSMLLFQTNVCIDANGTFWALGPWYGGDLHFRCNLGHWSERVLNLTEEIALTLEPWADYREPSKEAEAWGKYFTNPRLPEGGKEC